MRGRLALGWLITTIYRLRLLKLDIISVIIVLSVVAVVRGWGVGRRRVIRVVVVRLGVLVVRLLVVCVLRCHCCISIRKFMLAQMLQLLPGAWPAGVLPIAHPVPR